MCCWLNNLEVTVAQCESSLSNTCIPFPGHCTSLSLEHGAFKEHVHQERMPVSNCNTGQNAKTHFTLSSELNVIFSQAHRNRNPRWLTTCNTLTYLRKNTKNSFPELSKYFRIKNFTNMESTVPLYLHSTQNWGKVVDISKSFWSVTVASFPRSTLILSYLLMLQGKQKAPHSGDFVHV